MARVSAHQFDNHVDGVTYCAACGIWEGAATRECLPTAERRSGLVDAVVRASKSWWPSVRARANHARMPAKELDLWKAIRALKAHDGEGVHDKRHGGLHRLTTAKGSDGQMAARTKNFDSSTRDRAVERADFASGGSPRRARRREVVGVVRVRELVDSADPTTDASLPAWAREAVRDGRVIVRRSTTPDDEAVVVVVVVPVRSLHGSYETFARVEDFVILSSPVNSETSWGKCWICKSENFEQIFEVLESS